MCVCFFFLKSTTASTLYFKHFRGVIVLLWVLVFSLNLQKCFLPKIKRKLSRDAFYLIEKNAHMHVHMIFV